MASLVPKIRKLSELLEGDIIDYVDYADRLICVKWEKEIDDAITPYIKQNKTKLTNLTTYLNQYMIPDLSNIVINYQHPEFEKTVERLSGSYRAIGYTFFGKKEGLWITVRNVAGSRIQNYGTKIYKNGALIKKTSMWDHVR